MDHHIERRCDLAADRRQRKLRARQHHGFQPRQHILGTVAVTAAHAAVMTGIVAVQQLQSLFSTNLTYNDAARIHSQGRFDEVPDPDRPFPLRIGCPGLQTHQIFHLLDL